MDAARGQPPSRTAAPAPPGFSPEAFFRHVPYWHQRWELFRGVFVPGHNAVDFLCEATELPADLTGKRVLDVGAWNGCFSFECERRGAAEVVAVSLEDPAATGFDLLKAALNSRVEYRRGSVYTLMPELYGKFDVVLFFGVLYHLRYPLLALDRIRTVCRGEVHVETHVIDHRAWLRGPLRFLGKLPLVRSALRGTPLWRQYREFELHPGDQSNWFGPNVLAVLEAFQSAGFDIRHTRSWQDRAMFRARQTAVPERLRDHAYESVWENRAVTWLEPQTPASGAA
jgi:tRNA (mo5U34)-methyltransferase